MARREFTRDTYAAIMKRAEVATGWQCEKCGLIVATGHVDHVKPDGLEVDKTRKLTADEGQFLCLPCHSEKTKKDVAVIAKAKRVEARRVGATRPKQALKSAGFVKFEKPPIGKARVDKSALAPLPRRVCGVIVE